MVATAKKLLRTLDECHEELIKTGNPLHYSGERGSWYVVYSNGRDSEALYRSNFRSILAALGGEGEQVAIEEMSHWACGWVKHILLDPAAADKVEIAREILEGLESYGIVNETDFSELEFEEFTEVIDQEFGRKFGDDLEEAREIERAIMDEGRYGYSEDDAYRVIDAIHEELERREELRELGIPEEKITGKKPAPDCPGQLKMELEG